MSSHTFPRRRFLAGFGALPAAAVIGGTAMGSAPAAFYVSAAGNDDADGLTPETAWATVGKVNSQLPSQSSVHFRRGDTFYGELDLPLNCEVGAYGAGAKPILTMFKLLNRSAGWAEHSPGVWKIDLGSPDTHDGYTTTADANIGYLMVDGLVHPAKKKLLSELTAKWDFWSDTTNNTLYVAVGDNPAGLATDIKAAPRGMAGRIISCTQGANNIHDIHITGTGAHGINGAGADVQVHDCLIDYIGGSFLPGNGDGTVRYGNGIENWIGAKRWLVEANEIAQVYDVAYTCQGSGYDRPDTWEDMTIRNNHIHDCTQSFEFWSNGTNPAAGFKRILVEGNLCERAGYSDFSDVRPDQAVRVHLLTYGWDLPADITMQNNVFDEAYSAYSYHQKDPVGLVTRNNRIRLKAGTKMQFQSTDTVEQAAAWQQATGLETGSTITVLP
jgi:hypothetical protein